MHMAALRQQLERKSWMAVVRAYEACTRRYARMLGHFDLTIPQYDVLRTIQRLGADATPKRIADALVVTRGNITGLLQRLKSRGLLRTREHAVDGRSFVCELSGTAISLLASADKAAMAFVSEQLAPFDDEALVSTGRMMDAMAAHLAEMNPDCIAKKVLDKTSVTT